jgi:hypothetical protein
MPSASSDDTAEGSDHRINRLLHFFMLFLAISNDGPDAAMAMGESVGSSIP